jgi:hypothetical protein
METPITKFAIGGKPKEIIYVDPSKTSQRYWPIMVYVSKSVISCINNSHSLVPDDCDYITYYAENISIKFDLNQGPQFQIIDKENDTVYIVVVEYDYEDGFEFVQIHTRVAGKNTQRQNLPMISDYYKITKESSNIYLSHECGQITIAENYNKKKLELKNVIGSVISVKYNC